MVQILQVPLGVLGYLLAHHWQILFSHFDRNPTYSYSRNDGTNAKKACMSKGGIPIQPFVVLGGFNGTSEDPGYEKATAVVVTFIVDNYDAKDKDLENQEALKNAMEWEKVYIDFMKNWTTNEENLKYMDVAFNAERAIGDELERETYGDIVTIALSYIFMFIYITFSLGRITKWSRFMVIK